MRPGHRLRRLRPAGVLATLAAATHAAVATAAVTVPAAAVAVPAAAVALAAATLAVAASAPATHAVFGRVQQAFVGTWRPLFQEQVLPRWRGRCHRSQLRVRHRLHRLRGALQVATAVAAVVAAVAAAVSAVSAATVHLCE